MAGNESGRTVHDREAMRAPASVRQMELVCGVVCEQSRYGTVVLVGKYFRFPCVTCFPD